MRPMSYGSCAISASIVPALSACTWSGSASNSTSLTLPDFPACLVAVVTPFPEMTFMAKMPLRSGLPVRRAEVIWAALVWSSLSNWVPRYLMFGYLALSWASKPCLRWSVVLMPGWTLIPATVPFLPMEVARASAAALPPPMLSDEMLVKAIGAVMKVSTVATGIPAWMAFLIGAMSAVLSVGAIRIASGLAAIAALRKGIWVGGLNAFGAPWKTSFTPALAAAACAPVFIVT